MKVSLNDGREIDLDKDKAFPDPAAQAKKELQERYEERQAPKEWTKPCPECGEAVSALEAECPGCGADLRAVCKLCDLPLSGEEPVCRCGGFETEAEHKAFFRTSPRSKRANRPGGGSGHYWLRARRARYGY